MISAISAPPGPVPAKVTWPELQLTTPTQPGQMVPSAHITFHGYHSEGEDNPSDIQRPSVPSFSCQTEILKNELRKRKDTLPTKNRLLDLLCAGSQVPNCLIDA